MHRVPDPSLSRFAGTILLFDLLHEDRRSWIRFLLREIPRSVLDSDEALVDWMEERVRSDPNLVAELRAIVTHYVDLLETDHANEC